MFAHTMSRRTVADPVDAPIFAWRSRTSLPARYWTRSNSPNVPLVELTLMSTPNAPTASNQLVRVVVRALTQTSHGIQTFVPGSTLRTCAACLGWQRRRADARNAQRRRWVMLDSCN